MVLEIKLSLDDSDFVSEGLHKDNTIQVDFDGPSAFKTPLNDIKQFIVKAAKSANQEI